jgi:NAD-dependent dihydropyrimidine dehydrogenase PreA subunit
MMKVQVLVTLDVEQEPVTHPEAIVRECVRMAVENAVKNQEGWGFVHDLSDTVSIQVGEVALQQNVWCDHNNPVNVANEVCADCGAPLRL